MTYHHYPYPPHYAPPAPRNGLGLAALILGLVALPFTLTGLTAWIAIVLGLVAVPLAFAGLARVRRRTATNRGVGIAGLVLGVLAVVAGVASTVVTVQAIDDALSAPTVSTFDTDADGITVTEQATGPVNLGQTVSVDGLVLMVDGVEQRTEFGTRLTCAHVAYSNAREDAANRHPWDWSARNPQGASVSPWLYTGSDALDSGPLAPGGTDDGLVCFDAPRDEVAVIEYRTPLASEPVAEWLVNR